MGSRIAAQFANARIPSLLLDIVIPGGKARDQAARNGVETALKGKPGAFFTADAARLIATGNFEDDLSRLRECDWIIEAVSEDLAIKRGLYDRVMEHRAPGTIVSTNTSGIPLQQISEGYSQEFREHFLGIHFFNPPRYLHLVEMIPGAEGIGKRGFDHGVWSPLILMYPDAVIPVVEISVQPNKNAAHHYAVGQALTPLRNENILIMGSGSATHNLRELGRGGPHIIEFENWLCNAVEAGRGEDLIDYERKAPHARRNHPTPEHLLPLFAPLGAAEGKHGEVLNRVFDYASLSMAAFIWQAF